MTVDHANAVILECCVLHNIMRAKAPATYTPSGYADAVYPNGQIVNGTWRDDHHHTDNTRTIPRRPAKTAIEVRDGLVEYLSGPGAVEWQDAWVPITN